MKTSKITAAKKRSRDQLVAERKRVEQQLRALKDASDGENEPPHIRELEDRLYEIDERIDRIDIAIETERQRDA